MADIDIIVNSSQVKTAKQEIQELGNSFNSASKSASVFMQAFERAAKQSQRDEQYIRQTSTALRRLIDDNLKITNAYKSAEQSASAFTEGLRKQEAQALRTAKANQEAINKQLGVGGPSATSNGAGFGALDAQIERLRQKYDKIYASSQLYERSLNEMNQAHMLGVMSAKQHEAAVESLNTEYQAFQNGVAQAGNRFAEHVNQTASGMNKFGVITQQAGYQIGDFLVQVQSGTNWMVAFGQQATQLVGVLPMMTGFMGLSTGALVALSAGLGIAIPLVTAIGAAFMRTSEESDKSTKEFKRFEEGLETLGQKSVETVLNLEALKRGVAPDEILSSRLAIEALVQTLDQLRTTEVSGFMDALTRSDRIVAAQNLKVELEKALEALIRQTEYEQRLETAARRRANDLRDHYRAQIDINTAAEDAIAKYSMMRTVAAGIANEMGRAAANTQAAANAALTAMRMEFSPAGGALSQYGGRGSTSDRPITNQYGDVITLPGSNRPKRRPTDIDFGLPDVGSGGGGATEDALQKLREQLTLENELLGVSEAQKRVMQALGDQRSKYSEAEINAITAEVEAYNLKLEALKQQEQFAKVMQSSMENAFMSIVDGTESAKDAFKKMAYEIIKELYKVLVVQRMVGQFQSGGGGILGSAFKFLGGLGGGGMTGGAGRASGGSIMPGNAYMVGEHGPELVIPRHSGTVVNANQTANAKGGNGDITVQNNITVTGSDAAMVRAEVAKMIPQITNATKAAVIDARLRGGQMKAAFS